MNRQESLYLLLGIALGAILTSILFLRIPLVAHKAHELGIQKKTQKIEVPLQDQRVQVPNF